MANSDNSQNNTLQNQIDADNLYGLNTNANPSCIQGSCPANTVNTGFYIPSIEEIASYNPSAPSISSINPNSMQQNRSHQQGSNQSANTNMQMLQNKNAGGNSPTDGVASSQELPNTPATVLNYGATMGTTVREDLGMGITDIANPYPVTPESIQYLNGFIRTQIGRRVTIDFLVGSNSLVSKSGYLLGVAQNYILINELDTNDLTTCDFYNIKFIRFYY